MNLYYCVMRIRTVHPAHMGLQGTTIIYRNMRKIHKQDSQGYIIYLTNQIETRIRNKVIIVPVYS